MAINLVEQAAQRARDAEISIIAVGIGQDVTPSDLFRVTGSASRTFSLGGVEELGGIRQELMDQMCPLGAPGE
jgi:hypothetical protein